MKLTQREQLVLKAMQNGERCIYMPYAGRFNPNAYYTITGSVGKCTREIKKLIKLDLVGHETMGFNKANIYLTHEGEAYQCEVEKPCDVWVVNHENRVEINKYSGFLKDEILTLASGRVAKGSKYDKFFLNRDEAFNYAIDRQILNITYIERQVIWAKEHLTNIEKHAKNPEQDKAGYL